jgi:selenide,water dikinase
LAQVLQPLQGMFAPQDYPNLLVGLGEPDDAAVYRLNDEQALIVTTDFFPPVVDDAYAFGAIAAANALSDVYAMGGTPIMAINLVAFPDGLISVPLLSEILRGGAEKVLEAGAVVAGGHTVTDKEPKYGLAVTGLVHPDKIIHKSGIVPGDVLFLTKQLGVGVVTTALKRDIATDEEISAATESMLLLNKDAALAAQAVGVRAMTDITGYGFIGHALEMARLSQVAFRVELDAIEWLPGALRHAEADVFPGGMWNNREYLEPNISFPSGTPDPLQSLLYDPETSGGLLIAVSPEHADMLESELTQRGVLALRVGTAIEGNGTIEFH